MGHEALRVLLVAGRVDVGDGHWPVSPFLDRLERRGLTIQVLRVSSEVPQRDDSRVVLAPALSSPWLRTLRVRRLWSDGRLQRPDLLHLIHEGMDDVALSLAEGSSLPYIQTVSGFGTVDRGLRLSRRWCRGLVVTSADLASDLVGVLRVPPDRITVIPPGIPAQPVPKNADGRSRVPVIGTGGGRDETTGLLVFLAAARRVLDAGYDVEFLVGGHGCDQAVLRHHAHRLEIADRVTVADYSSVGRELWTVTDIFCQPAVTASSGGMLMHALAHGVACVATDVKGLRSLIEPGKTGLIVAPADAAALAHAVITLLECPGEARLLGQHALEDARVRFDADFEADRLASLYRHAVRSEGHWNRVER